MPEVDNINGEYVIKDVVDDAVIGYAYAETIPSFYFFVTLRAWVIGEAEDGGFYFGEIGSSFFPSSQSLPTYEETLRFGVKLNFDL